MIHGLNITNVEFEYEYLYIFFQYVYFQTIMG